MKGWVEPAFYVVFMKKNFFWTVIGADARVETGTRNKRVPGEPSY